ncbi:MAG TPA: THUMP domain-containing protein, partial [Bdellovibrionota bacterium]|nr:THUMP domain-containing protein [Bdellovibrionota bacterium]
MPAFFATCLRGLEGPLTAELKTFGVEKADAARAGVAFEGSWESALRACLWSRLASRILLPLAESEIRDAQALYNVAREFPWEQHLDLNQTFRIEAHGTSPGINHTGFAALKVKDAVADRFRSRLGRRPSVDADNPDTRIHVLLRDNYVKFSLDLSGESLHRRGYRTRAGEAPLGETLAAGVLWLAGWPEMAKAGAPFVDPCCGSGTLVIEAALWAADVAPGLAAGRAFGAERWPGLDRALWGKLQAEAAQRRAAGLETLKAGRFLGCDKDTSLLRATRTNADAAGLGSYLRFERREFSEWLPSHVPEGPGLIAANPPYGERMGQEAEATALYVEIGNLLRRCFGGWEAAILASNSGLNHRLGLRARKVQALKNGPLDVQLAVLSIPKAVEGQPVEAPRLSETATAFRNRLIKMHK